MDRPNSEQINFFIQTMVRNNCKATEIHKLLCNAWGEENVVKERRVQQLAKEYQENVRTDSSRKARSGRKRTSRTEEMQEEIASLLTEDPRLSIEHISNATQLSWSSVQRIATIDLQKRSVCAKWIPHKLTDVHKQQRVDGARIILRDVDPSVMVIDEKWLYSHPFPSTNNVRAWINKIGGQGDRPTIAHRNISEVKFHIIVANNFRGLCHFVILQRNETVNALRYIEFLKALSEVKRGHFKIMHDNARPHTAAIAVAHLRENSIGRIPQPPYSSDMNLLDRFVFRNMEVAKKDKVFDSIDDAQLFVSNFLNSINQSSLRREYDRFRSDLQRIIDCGGDYLSTV